jgi:hypothetical protein
MFSAPPSKVTVIESKPKVSLEDLKTGCTPGPTRSEPATGRRYKGGIATCKSTFAPMDHPMRSTGSKKTAELSMALIFASQGEGETSRMDRDNLMRLFVLDAIVNDYEDFQMVVNEVVGWGAERGLKISLPEVSEALVGLIKDDLASAYQVSATRTIERSCWRSALGGSYRSLFFCN